MLFAFDLDGTLIDSRDAVVAAYAMAGVRMPTTAWGKPASAWCRDETLHALKNHHYPKALMQYGKPGPALPLFNAVRQAHHVIIVTGASPDGANAALGYLGVKDFAPAHLHTRCDAAHKRELCRKHAARHEHCFFVDTDVKECEIVAGIANWSFINICSQEQLC